MENTVLELHWGQKVQPGYVRKCRTEGLPCWPTACLGDLCWCHHLVKRLVRAIGIAGSSLAGFPLYICEQGMAVTQEMLLMGRSEMGYIAGTCSRVVCILSCVA